MYPVVLSIMDTLQLVFLLLMRIKLRAEHRDIWVSWWFKYTYMGFIFFPLISSWSNMKKKCDSSLCHLTVSSGLRKQKLTSALKRSVCRNHKVNWWHAACSECWWSAGRWRAIVGDSPWERIPLWVGFTYIHRWKGHRTDWRQAGGNWLERSPSTCSLPRLQDPIIFSVCLYF